MEMIIPPKKTFPFYINVLMCSLAIILEAIIITPIARWGGPFAVRGVLTVIEEPVYGAIFLTILVGAAVGVLPTMWGGAILGALAHYKTRNKLASTILGLVSSILVFALTAFFVMKIAYLNFCEWQNLSWTQFEGETVDFLPRMFCHLIPLGLLMFWAATTKSFDEAKALMWD